MQAEVFCKLPIVSMQELHKDTVLRNHLKHKSCYRDLHDTLFMHSQSQVIKQFPSLRPFPKTHKKTETKRITTALKRFHQNSFMDAQLC